MKLELGHLYKQEVIDSYHKEFHVNREYVIGFDLNKRFFIKFGDFEFWETERDEVGERLYLCHKTDEGYYEKPPEMVILFHDRNKRKTRQYYTRYDKQSLAARKWGSEFKG